MKTVKDILKTKTQLTKNSIEIKNTGFKLNNPNGNFLYCCIPCAIYDNFTEKDIHSFAYKPNFPFFCDNPTHDEIYANFTSFSNPV